MSERASLQRWAEAVRGRGQWTEEQGREVLSRLEASGLSVGQFAKRTGLVPQRLYWWRSRLGKTSGGSVARAEQPGASFSFVPVVVREGARTASESAPLRVRIGERVEVDIREVDTSTAAWVAWLALACAGEAAT